LHARFILSQQSAPNGLKTTAIQDTISPDVLEFQIASCFGLSKMATHRMEHQARYSADFCCGHKTFSDSIQSFAPEGGRVRRSKVDVVGLGLNATDTILTVEEFPPLGGKKRVVSLSRQAGGQVATAVLTCRRLGLRARYVGKVGNDEAGRLQLQSLREEGIDVQYTRVVRGATTQYGLIIVDRSTGERTVFWDRDERLAVRPRELKPGAITTARILHLDGCDAAACIQAAKWARAAGIAVMADIDTVYNDVEELLPLIDYPIASADFLPAITGKSDPFRALEHTARAYGTRVPGMTLGRDGALLYSEGRFYYSPGFVVKTVDTTGAGDVFHGAFAYGLLRGWALEHILDFSNAMAALNCTRVGARGSIASRSEAEKLMATGRRHRNPDYARLPRPGAGSIVHRKMKKRSRG
jgi:sulfofructose kinase